METGQSRASFTGIVSLPSAVALGVLFFLPWLRLSCSAQGMMDAGEMQDAPPFVMSAMGTQEIGRASGWDLARGEITPAHGSKPPARPDGAPQFPKPRLWVYVGLLLPVLAAIASLLVLGGRMPAGGAGKAMVVLGVAGIVLLLLVSQIDYVDDAVSLQTSGHPPCPAAAQSEALATSKMKQILKTQATGYLWASMALYGVVAACGLIMAGASQGAGGSAYKAEPGQAFRTESIAARGPVAGAAPPARHVPGLPAANRPTQPTAAPRSDGLPDFGPSLTAPAPTERQTHSTGPTS